MAKMPNSSIKGIVALAAGLKLNNSTKTFSIVDSGITPKGAAWVAAALRPEGDRGVRRIPLCIIFFFL